MDIEQESDSISTETPQLVVLEQSPPSACDPGSTKHIHTVVKNIPFDIRLGFHDNVATGCELDFNDFNFDAKLLYDTPQLKEVDYINHQPFEMRRIIQQSGKVVELQCKIKVLSSHHENLSFRLKIHALHPVNGEEVSSSLSVLSHPIRVISKPERKNITKKPKSTAPKRRRINDRIQDSVKMIQDLQNSQREAMNTLSNWIHVNHGKDKNTTILPIPNTLNEVNESPSIRNSMPNPTFQISSKEVEEPLFSSSPSVGFNYWKEQEETIPPIPSPSFLSEIPKNLLIAQLGNQNISESSSAFCYAFENFMMLYNTMDTEERHDRIRRLLRNSSKSDLDLVSSFLKILVDNGIKLCSQNVGCTCSFCPYELQLHQINLEQTFSMPPESFSFYPE